MEWVALRRSFIFLLIGTACNTNTSLPDTPEEVIRKYQKYIDLNQYHAAIALSTPAEQRRLEKEAQIIALAPTDSTIFHTRFKQLDCREAAAKITICSCWMEDEYGVYNGLFRLVKMNGEWRVDIPVEDIPADAYQPKNR